MKDTGRHFYKEMDSPVGRIKLIASDRGLTAILWESEGFSRIKSDTPAEDNHHPILVKAEQELNEYFEGKRTSFDMVFDLATGTEFQKKVWDALLTIPFGETRSYGAIAKQTGDPKASRAVGGAVNKNPVSIMIPCHRVIGTTGKLVGFAGGLQNKACLLKIENPSKQGTLEL